MFNFVPMEAVVGHGRRGRRSSGLLARIADAALAEGKRFELLWATPSPVFKMLHYATNGDHRGTRRGKSKASVIVSCPTGSIGVSAPGL